MQILRPYHKPIESEFLGLGPGICLLKVISPSGSHSNDHWSLRTTVQHSLWRPTWVYVPSQDVTMTGTSKPLYLPFMIWDHTFSAQMRKQAHRRWPSVRLHCTWVPPGTPSTTLRYN